MVWPNPITNPEYYQNKHPVLPAGLNADDVNSDVVDGAGTNWPIWPMVFDTYQGFAPLILDDAKMEVFDGCADWVIPAEFNEVSIAYTSRDTIIGGTWPDIVPPATNTTIVIPYQSREQKIKNISGIITASGSSQTVTMAPETDEQVIARRSP